MPKIEFNGNEIEIDDHGFLINPDDWNEDLCSFLYGNLSTGNLTEEHWTVIYFLRNFYMHKGFIPLIRKLCISCDFSLQKIYQLFPDGPVKGAVRIAGLPFQAGCI